VIISGRLFIMINLKGFEMIKLVYDFVVKILFLETISI